jgi:hypothetical protein
MFRRHKFLRKDRLEALKSTSVWSLGFGGGMSGPRRDAGSPLRQI